jgi:hypothetical protein
MTQTWPMRSMPILFAAHVSKISSTTCDADVSATRLQHSTARSMRA